MKSDLVKVLHPVAGRPMLGHVLHAVGHVAPEHVAVVVGHQRERVREYLDDQHLGVLTAVQEEQRGTGHAVRVCLEQVAAQGVDLAGLEGPVVVLTGDTPLLTGETLALLVEHHGGAGAASTVLTAVVEDPTGYGRIVRDADDRVVAIVEHRDATPEQLAVHEVNSGMYAFEPAALVATLGRLTTANAQGEEYLTDVLGLLHGDGAVVAAVSTPDPREILGVNDRVQLATCAAILRERINERWMRAGVTVVDPASTWIDVDAEFGRDVVVRPGTVVQGPCSIADGAEIGPHTTLVACEVGRGARVLRSHCEFAVIGDEANVGPYSYLRPNAVLAERAKAGAFVEIKNSVVGPGSKVPHLSYVGDADIGAGSNIGAATVFVNYDGVAKHRTVVGDAVRIGSDTMLVAPLTIGDGAYTAAGSVITDDVPPGAMAVGRARQRNVEGWVTRKRAGTTAAAAAEAALADDTPASGAAASGDNGPTAPASDGGST